MVRRCWRCCYPDRERRIFSSAFQVTLLPFMSFTRRAQALKKAEVKHCSGCDTDKPASAFRPRRDRWLHHLCIVCDSQKNKERRAASTLTFIDYRARRLRYRFAITMKEYDMMLKKQNGVCAICLRPEIVTEPRTGVTRHLSIDHCHSTGQIRGLLCARCNTGIGKLGDSPETLRKAANYLEQGGYQNS